MQGRCYVWHRNLDSVHHAGLQDKCMGDFMFIAASYHMFVHNDSVWVVYVSTWPPVLCFVCVIIDIKVFEDRES